MTLKKPDQVLPPTPRWVKPADLPQVALLRRHDGTLALFNVTEAAPVEPEPTRDPTAFETRPKPKKG